MKLSTVLYLFIPVLLFSGCAANKQLETVKLQVDELEARNQELTKNINSMKREVSNLTTQNQSITSEYSQYKAKCQEVQDKYAMAQGILDEEAESLEQITAKLEAALIDFENKGVEVYYKNGFVYVSMADNLLYKSGSAALDENGKKALSNIASVLNEYPKLKIVVLGNTDDVQFAKGNSDNWSLSTERANGVVRVFRDMYKVDPARLTAAGKGKYNPIADNSTAEGRAKNRRTDIILNPDLDKLWDTINR